MIVVKKNVWLVILLVHHVLVFPITVNPVSLTFIWITQHVLIVQTLVQLVVQQTPVNHA
ncbi:unnamed protein product, partial (macronuclear) [Paramecium tetraurelia]